MDDIARAFAGGEDERRDLLVHGADRMDADRTDVDLIDASRRAAGVPRVTSWSRSASGESLLKTVKGTSGLSGSEDGLAFGAGTLLLAKCGGS